MPIIDVRNLSKSYQTTVKAAGLAGTIRHFFNREHKTVHAVRDASFSIEKGEIVGFLGPNGAGKTTTLKMLTGLIYPTAGTLLVAGHEPRKRESAFLRKITLVMGQKQQLMWDLPVLESLRINGAIYDIPPAEYKDRLDELTTMLSLGGLLASPVRKLSLGERMKAELLAALLHQPSVLFLDEPTLGLDVNAQSAVREFLMQYNRKFQATILLTSHYMADITALCKRVILIHQGSLIHDGALAEIVDRVAPYRQVSLELARPMAHAELSVFGEVESIEGRAVKLIVRREELTRAVGRMMSDLPVVDMMIADPPVERIIGDVFSQGIVSAGENKS